MSLYMIVSTLEEKLSSNKYIHYVMKFSGFPEKRKNAK